MWTFSRVFFNIEMKTKPENILLLLTDVKVVNVDMKWQVDKNRS